MNIFPEIDENDELNLEEKEPKGTKEILFDFDKKRVKITDGKVVLGTEVEQVQQWIELLLLTEGEKFKVYKNTQFGMTDLYSLIGHNYLNNPYGISELTRELKEKIEVKKEVKEVINISTESDFNALKIKITVLLKSGKTLEKEVSI
ncbi:MAG: DUF2634 domain-containing protein [Fusobacteriaceae bacterium]